MIEQIVFLVSLLSVTSIFALSAVSMKVEGFEFFPPPSKESWQHRSFKLLFRGFVYPLVVLTILAFEFSTAPFAIARYVFGAVLLIIGFGLAFRITFSMGWRNAFGEKHGLKTTGWFAGSRNPVYVATWIGIAGWALISFQTSVAILLSAWSLMYLLAPIVEEPWLEMQYGKEYKDYKSEVPRFF